MAPRSSTPAGKTSTTKASSTNASITKAARPAKSATAKKIETGISKAFNQTTDLETTRARSPIIKNLLHAQVRADDDLQGPSDGQESVHIESQSPDFDQYEEDLRAYADIPAIDYVEEEESILDAESQSAIVRVKREHSRASSDSQDLMAFANKCTSGLHHERETSTEPERIKEEESSDRENIKIVSNKRKYSLRDELESSTESKRVKKEESPGPKPKTTKLMKKPRKGIVINRSPLCLLDAFSFGQGDEGQLGFGTQACNLVKPTPEPIPSISRKLGSSVRIAQVSVGKNHAIALTDHNQIATWGYNMYSALGRETFQAPFDECDPETNVNIHTATPAIVDMSEAAPGIVFTSVAASDTCSFAVTDDGNVWGCGGFRCNSGLLGFAPMNTLQETPAQIKTLRKIKQVACGSQHALALDDKGDVWSWGSGEKGQLGRRLLHRNIVSGLVPVKCLARKNITGISAGKDYSVAIAACGDVYVWGTNEHGQCCVRDGLARADLEINKPTVCAALTALKMKSISCGRQHGIGITGDDDVVVWGRSDSSQAGVDLNTVPPQSLLCDELGHMRIITAPVVVPVGKAAFVSAGADTSFAVGLDGKAFAWGAGGGYRHGLGTDKDVKTPSPLPGYIDSKTVVWIGGGEEFGVAATTG